MDLVRRIDGPRDREDETVTEIIAILTAERCRLGQRDVEV